MTPQEQSTFYNEETDYNEDIEPQQIIRETKFILLCFLSFGLYLIWWTYKAHSFFRDREGTTINPALKASLNVIFLIPLMNKIRKLAREQGYQSTFYPIPLYLLFLFFSLLGLLPLSVFSIFAYLGCIFIIPALKAFNFIIENTQGVRCYIKSGLNTRQTILVILGGIMWFLLLIGGLFLLLSGYTH